VSSSAIQRSIPQIRFLAFHFARKDRSGDAFLSDPLCRYRGTGVYVETAGTGKAQLAVRNAIDPAWSPDGSLLAVSRMDERGQVDIWLVHRDGRGLRRVTDTPEVDRCPVWLRGKE